MKLVEAIRVLGDSNAVAAMDVLNEASPEELAALEVDLTFALQHKRAELAVLEAVIRAARRKVAA